MACLREMERDIRPTAGAALTNGSEDYGKIPPAADNGERKRRVVNVSVSALRPLAPAAAVCTGR